MSTSLLQRFRVSELQLDEFDNVLLTHFHSGTQLEDGSVVFPNDPQQYAIQVVYDAAGHGISDVIAGPALTDADVAALHTRIEADLLSDTSSMIGSAILFSNVPCRHAVKYRDVQILPVPPDAPQPSTVYASYPFVMQFAFRNSPGVTTRIERRMSVGREYELFLAGVLNIGVRSLVSDGREHWVLLQPGDSEGAKVGLRHEGYFVETLPVESDNFLPITAEPSMAIVPGTTYYARIGVGFDSVFDLPDCFAILYDKYFALPIVQRDQFLRACYWFQYAHRAHGHSRSAAFTALISAVEALMPTSLPTEKCATCGRPVGKGPTKQFIEFVDRLAPHSGNDRRRLYAMRSALSHGGKLLRSDKPGWSKALTPAGMAEWGDTHYAWHLVQYVMVNWLLEQ